MDNLLHQSIENVRYQQKTQSCDSVDINSVRKGRPYPTILNHKSYPLNKSRSKFVAVGLQAYGRFSPVIQLYGLKKDWIILNESEWKQLVEWKSAIVKYCETNELPPHPITLSDSKRVSFRTVSFNKVIIIEDNSGGEIYLAVETLKEVWSLQSLLEYTIEILKSLEFHLFYNSIIRGVAPMGGIITDNIASVLDNLIVTSENKLCMMEMLKFGQDIIKCDIEIEQVGLMRL